VVLTLTLLAASSAQALTLQQVGSFDQPIYVTSDPGNAGRLFVVEREGGIKLVENGVATLFADLTSEVACPVGGCGGERGLLSIALDPSFPDNGRLFAVYTSEADGTIYVDELAAAPDRKSASVVKTVASIPHSESNTHNGGQLQFGPDGNLYLSTGDGGGKNDQFHHAQKPNDPLGKILRLVPGSVPPYTVWSSGLRNPYRFSFDSLTGDMVIGDVGQGLREEIDFAPSPFPGVPGGQNANYGWNCREGFLAGPQGPGIPDPECATPPASGFVDPVLDYPHSPDPDLGGAVRCAITGGYVARDPGLGALYGRYLYADFCAGVLRSLQLPASASGAATSDCSLGLRLKNPVSFGEDAARRLYVAELGGAVYRLAGLPPTSCPVVPQTPTQAEPQARPTFIGIKAQRRRVERGKRALLTVWVSPCTGRKGDPVTLLRNGRRNGSRFLSRACTARFLPQVRRGTTFAAFTHEDGVDNYLPGKSRKLKIRIAHRQRVQRPR
jgi:hypothetical protein